MSPSNHSAALFFINFRRPTKPNLLWTMTTETKAQEYLPLHWHVGVHRNNNIRFVFPQQPVQAASLFITLLFIPWFSISVHVGCREEHKILGLFAASCFDTQLIRCNTGVELHGRSSLSPEKTCFPSGEKNDSLYTSPIHHQDTTSFCKHNLFFLLLAWKHFKWFYLCKAFI